MTLNERELFESDLAEHLIERDANGFYINDEIQNYWEKHLLKAKVKELKAELEKAKAQAVPEGYVVLQKEVATRAINHIAIAMCHPNNTRDEENIMAKDQEIIERAIDASESGAEG